MEDIKPIDKFTLDKYVREEDDLLEYVEMLGCKCHPDYDFIRVKKEIEDRTETNETEVATEQQATEQQAAAEEEEEEDLLMINYRRRITNNEIQTMNYKLSVWKRKLYLSQAPLPV